MTQLLKQAEAGDEPIVHVLIVRERGGEAAWLEQMLAHTESGRFEVGQVDKLDGQVVERCRGGVDVVLIDLPSGDHASLEALLEPTRPGPFPPVIVINHTDAQLSGVRAVHEGVQDYLLRASLSADTLARSIRYAIERDALHQRARAEAERFQAVVNANADGMLVIDREGVIRLANPMAEQLLNRPASQLVGSVFGVPVVGGESTEIAIHRRDGSNGVAEMRLAPLRWENAPAMLATLRDISDRKAIEAELLGHREQMQALSAELSRVEQDERRRLAQLLHDDLQQWLVAVRIQLDVLRKATRHTPEHAPATRGLEMLDQAIAVSRSLTAELSPTMLYELGLPSAIRWLGRTMEQRHGLAVTVEAEEPTEPPSEELRTFLFQSVRELLLNVVKHASVNEARVIMTVDPGPTIRIAVADAGSGMDASQMQRRPVEGSFGLFNIRQRLEYWGGTLEIDSQPGAGTRVTIHAPYRAMTDGSPSATSAADHAPNHPPRQRADAERDAVRLLLADDHQLVREGLVGLLQGHPAIRIVGEANDGREALELARKLHPDVVVMDVAMPGMDGIAATRSIASELPETRLVGLSMYDLPHIAQAMYAAGADAYLPKGSPTDELIAAILGKRPSKAAS